MVFFSYDFGESVVTLEGSILLFFTYMSFMCLLKVFSSYFFSPRCIVRTFGHFLMTLRGVFFLSCGDIKKVVNDLNICTDNFVHDKYFVAYFYGG